MNKFKTIDEAYSATLKALLDNHDFKGKPRGASTLEIMNWMFTVRQPTKGPIITASESRNQVVAEYQAKEIELYLSGERQAGTWADKASKFWGKLANPDGTINSNYGWLTMHNQSLPQKKTPWEWVWSSLIHDRDSRQAYLRVSLPEHQWEGNKDQVCTIHVMFMIRNDQLHATTVMRSNDVVRGLVYDMPWWCLVMEMMRKELDQRGLLVELGTYSHLAHSMHLYTKDISLAKKMLGRA